MALDAAGPRVDTYDIGAGRDPQRAVAVGDPRYRGVPDSEPPGDPARPRIDTQHAGTEALVLGGPHEAASARDSLSGRPREPHDPKLPVGRRIDAEQALLRSQQQPRGAGREHHVGRGIGRNGPDGATCSRVDEAECVRPQRQLLYLVSGTSGHVCVADGDDAADRHPRREEHGGGSDATPTPRPGASAYCVARGRHEIATGPVTIVRLLRQRLREHPLESRQVRRLLLEVREDDRRI